MEAPVLSDTLVRLSKHWVEGLVAVSECRRRVSGDGKGSNVNLEQIEYECSESPGQIPVYEARSSSQCIISYHPLVRVCRVVGSIQEFTVLQLFTQSLKQIHRFIEGGRHGHSSQVFT